MLCHHTVSCHHAMSSCRIMSSCHVIIPYGNSSLHISYQHTRFCTQESMPQRAYLDTHVFCCQQTALRTHQRALQAPPSRSIGCQNCTQTPSHWKQGAGKLLLLVARWLQQSHGQQQWQRQYL
jgi:hypothetical protein